MDDLSGWNLRGYDNADDVLLASDGGRLRSIQKSPSDDARVKLSGRDAYIQHLTRGTDEEPEEFDEDEEPSESDDETQHYDADASHDTELSGRDLYIRGLQVRQR